MIIDSHVHVWSEATDPRHDPLPWLSEQAQHTYRTITLDQVDTEMAQAGVDGIVLVQTANELRHNDELFAAADSSTRAARVVAWVPLADPDGTRAALRRYHTRRDLTGVRHRIRDGDDPHLLVRPRVSESLALIAQAGLSLDVMPWPAGVLEQVPQIARRHPDLTIVIDMLGWPAVGERRMQPWTDHLAEAAAEPGVHIKVGGLFRLSGDHPDPDAWRPYVSTAVNLFGPERLMLGTNWPTMRAFGRTYTETMQMLLSSFDELIEVERAQVLAGTARRVYRFDAAPGE